MLLFGGRLTYAEYAKIGSVSGLPYYYLMNFNDFFSAMIVLFQQMVVNNWWVVVDMTSAYAPQPGWFVKCFFILFWIVIVLVMVNIIISIVLEIHGKLAPQVTK